MLMKRLKFTLWSAGYQTMRCSWRQVGPEDSFSGIKKKNQRLKQRWRQGQCDYHCIEVGDGRQMGIYSRRPFPLKSMEISRVCFRNQWNPWKQQPCSDRNFGASEAFSLRLACQLQTEVGQRATAAVHNTSAPAHP